MVRTDKIRQVLVALVFVSMITIPGVDYFLSFIPKVESMENRNMMKYPDFDTIGYSMFPTVIDSFWLDNFSMRNQLLALNSSIKYKAFRVPPIRGQAYIGKSGWMFIVKKELPHYLGETKAGNEELENYYKVFRYRRDFLKKQGCSFYLVIAPIKSSVYPEYIPLSRRKDIDSTLTDQIVALGDTMEGIEVIDLRKALVEGKKKGRLYHITDNHWNEYGAFIASQAILKELGNEYPMISLLNESDFEKSFFLNEGMPLSKMMGIYDGSVEEYITFRQVRNKRGKEGMKSNYPVYSWFPYKDKYEMVYSTGTDSLPNILVIRESFGKYVIPYLSERFGKSVYIFDGWRHGLNEEIVENEKPDIFVQLVLESFLPNILSGSKTPGVPKKSE